MKLGGKRYSEDGKTWIRVIGCYGYGSQGCLYRVSLPCSEIYSPTGMSEAEIRTYYPCPES